MATRRRKIKIDPIVVNPNLKDIQSSLAYSKITKEIIKYILCQKKQIPYPYEHLEYIARKEKESKHILSASKCNSRDTLKGRTHCRKATEAFEALEKIFQHIDAELSSSINGGVEEILILLGSTPVSPKEVYRILLPTTTSDSAKKEPSNRSLIQLIRCILMSEDLHELISKPISPTNTFVFLKKQAGLKCNWFLPKEHYSLPSRGHQAVFCLRSTVISDTHNTDLNSADIKTTDFPIYEDESVNINTESILVSRSEIKNDNFVVNIEKTTKVFFPDQMESIKNSIDPTATSVVPDKCNIRVVETPAENNNASYVSVCLDVENVELKANESKCYGATHKIIANTSKHIEKGNRTLRTINTMQWYQARMSVKGYKNYVSSKISSSDILIHF